MTREEFTEDGKEPALNAAKEGSSNPSLSVISPVENGLVCLAAAAARLAGIPVDSEGLLRAFPIHGRPHNGDNAPPSRKEDRTQGRA